MNDYQMMRLADNQDDDAVAPDECEAEAQDFAQKYADFYDDVKLKNDTKQDW